MVRIEHVCYFGYKGIPKPIKNVNVAELINWTLCLWLVHNTAKVRKYVLIYTEDAGWPSQQVLP